CLGETMNMISLFGVIMVLGIVVDDAIVVGEAIYVHRRKGQSPLRAAVEGVAEVAMPVFAAVTTTVVAFIPLAFVGGVMGKFIEILPTVVIASLLVSLWECLFLLPAHLSHLPDLNRSVPKWNPLYQLQRFVQAALDLFINRIYLPFLAWALHWRYIFLAISIASLLLAAGLVQGGLVKFQVFPKTDSFVVTANVSFPEGTPLDVTLQALKRIEQAFLRVAGRTQTVSGDPLIEQRMILVGQSLSSLQRGQTGSHLGSVQFIMLPEEKRGVHSNDLMVAWEEEIGSVAGAKSLTFEGESHGPGGAELEFWIQGERMADITSAAEQLQEKLRSYSGVVQIRSDNTPGKNEFRLTLKPEAKSLGLTVEDLALQVNAGFYGREAFRVQRGQDDIRVKVRYTLEERSRVTDFQHMRIRTSAGQEVPLLSVADMEFGPGFSVITRTDGMRRVAVTADVDPKRANAQEVFDDLASFFQQLEERYPGLHVSTQGEKKNMRESFAPLKVTVPLAVLGIFVIVATVFRSYIQPLVILVSIPFGIIGAILAHLLLGFDLSMMSMFGMVALTGVVVNDAIVLIERINENLAEGMSFFNAVIKGGARRFRAILLTSVSTVGGLAPLILETDMQARFLIPMALSLAGGVVGSTVLTLVLIPSLLAIVNDWRRVIGRLQTGIWLEREAVEPAAARRVDRME
ncbi:AcrB/AcrD/AcrF family protein, partial [Candidatus Electrothrix marina]